MKKAPEETPDIHWWQSKKFMAFLIGEFTWKIMALVILYVVTYFQGGSLSGSWLSVLTLIIITAGVLELGFIGGQAWIDRYTRTVAPFVSKLSVTKESKGEEENEEA